MDTEQTTEQQTTTEATETPATRDELIAAVREAGGVESVDVEAEEQVAAAATQTTEQAAEAAPDPQARLDAILKAREASHKKRLEGDDYFEARKRAAEQEAQRIVDEARAAAKRAAEEETVGFRDRFRKDPTGTLRTLDDDPQKVIDAVVQQGTPEWRALQEAREEARQAREEAKVGSKAAEDLKRLREEQAAEKRAAHEQSVRQAFLSEHAPEEKAPYLYASCRGNPQRVFSECDALCREWQQDGLKLGDRSLGPEYFDQSDLVAYLEKQSKEAFSKVPGVTPAQQVSAGAPAKGPGNAPKVPANATRTLSAAQGSERRTSPKPLSELSAEEQRKALIEEVAAARRANPDATS